MKENYADRIKTLLSAEEACRFYGIEVVRNKARCPFHHDDNPSMILYNGNKGWWCYACNQGGSVIDLVMKLFNLNFVEAMGKINDDFHLGLPLHSDRNVMDYVAEARATAERQRQAQLRDEAERKAREEYGKALGGYLDAYDRAKWEVNPFVRAMAREELERKAFLLAVEEIKQAERRRT
jgi:DNA primase